MSVCDVVSLNINLNMDLVKVTRVCARSLMTPTQVVSWFLGE